MKVVFVLVACLVGMVEAKCSGNGELRSFKENGTSNIVQRCVCHSNYTGPLCSTKLACDKGECGKDKCVFKKEDGSCDCRACQSRDQIEDVCLNHLCENNSTCYPIIPEGKDSGDKANKKYGCHCIQNFGGSFCNETKCLKKCPVENANCTIDKHPGNNTEYQYCKCNRQGYTGPTCEEDINECAIAKDICITGICINTQGSFKCNCTGNYEGPRCGKEKNYCDSNPCMNDGVCIKDNGTYRCSCKNNFTGRDCESKIPMCRRLPCKNGGTCRDDGSCFCVTGYSGSTCETNIDDCKDIDCNHGQCHDLLDSYICNCTLGYHGQHCDKDFCDPDSCENGGTCERQAAGYKCRCDNNYSGVNCSETECFCQHGECVGKGLCKCHSGWKGKICNIEACPVESCVTSDGECDERCNNKICNYGNFSCTLGVQPYQDCPQCADLGGNGKCDSQCNNPKCLFDGGECLPKLKCKFESTCREMYNDSICQQLCSTPECGLDNLSCSKEESKPVKGRLVLVVGGTIESFNRQKEEFERDLSIILNSHVVVKSVIVEETSSDSKRTRRAVAKSKSRLKVKAAMDNRECKSNCFETTKEAANYLGLLKSKDELKLPVDVYSLSSEPDPKPPEGTDIAPLWIGLMVIAPVLAVAMIYKGRHIVKTKLWSADDGGHRESHGTRMEPVGHENEMRSLTDRCSNSPDSARESKRFKLEVLGSSEYLNNHVVCRYEPSAPFLNSQNDHSPFYEHALLTAVSSDDVSAVGELLDSADVNVRDRSGRTALHLAISAGSFYGQMIFNMLIRHRAINPDLQDNYGSTPLMMACKQRLWLQQVDELITLGCKVSLSDKQGKTALHVAAQIDNHEAAELLIKHGAKVDARDNKSRTPLLLCVQEGSYKTAFVLLNNFASQSCGDMDDQTPLSVARKNCDQQMVELLTGYVSSPGVIPSPGYSEIRPKLVNGHNLEPAKPKRKRKSKDRKDAPENFSMIGTIAPINPPTTVVNGMPLNKETQNSFSMSNHDFQLQKFLEPDSFLKEMPSWERTATQRQPVPADSGVYPQTISPANINANLEFTSPIDTPVSIIDESDLSPFSDSIPNIMTPPPSWETSPASDYSDKF